MRMDGGIGIWSPGLGLLVTFAVCLCRSDSRECLQPSVQ